ncbi:TetR family transcriptional regulator [Streptomyces sp. NPDC048297]|uniref:TetR/AcrR family transcriptional regulator n=1 Tax=Streptomyces sp. NPDC048297 TaxID=3365531 RepID=UPI003720FD46
MTERRKAETRAEIARAAAALFVRQGLKATRAEDIAQAAGIAPRTFYRYFASKEEAVAPLYAAGAQRWTQAVREAPSSLTVPEALRHAVAHMLAPGHGVSTASWEWVRTLIHLADASTALRKVWAEVCQESDEELAQVLADRLAATTGGPAATSGPATTGGPAATSGPATTGGPAATGGPATTGGSPTTNPGAATATSVAPGKPITPAPVAPVAAVTALAAGEDNVAAPAPITPHLRFAAAVAGAAVRVAVESWAATLSSPTGPDGPAALALRNLEALGDFAWRAEL